MRRGGGGDQGPSREELEREAARDLQRAGGLGPPGGGYQRPTTRPGGWSPPEPGAPLLEPQPGDEEEQDSEGEGDEAYEVEEAVTEIALSQLAERAGSERSLEDVAIRVDPDSAYAARDRALQEHLKRREALKANLPKVPWDPSRRITFGHRPDSVLAKKGAKKAAKGAKKAAKGAKKAPAKKAPAKKAAAPPSVEADELPIEDYDDLTPAEVLSVLDELDDEELDLVAEYEEQHSNRPEILDAIDELFEEEAPLQEAPAEKVAAKKAPAKKVTAKRVPAKKVPAKKVAAKKVAAKKATAKKAPAKRAPAKRAAAKKAAAKKASATSAAKKASATSAAKKARR